MKRIDIVMLLLFVVGLLCLPVFPDELVKDAVLTGNHFAQDKIVDYLLGGEIETTEDDFEYEFKRRPNGEIYWIEINGETIVSETDDPVYSIPLPSEGDILSVDFWIEGVNKFGDEVCEGDIYLVKPPNGFFMNFLVRIDDIYKTVVVNMPQGISPEETYLVLNDEEWRTYRYDNYRNGYSFWYNPTEIGQTYKILYGGQVIMSGSLEDLIGSKPVPAGDPVSLVGVDFPENIEIVDYSDDSYYREIKFVGLTLNSKTSKVSADGELEDAKVFAIQRNEENMRWGVGASIRGVDSVTVTVFAEDNQGNLIKIEDPLIIYGNYGYAYFSISTQYYQNLTLVLTDIEYAYSNRSFEINFGGGKG